MQEPGTPLSRCDYDLAELEDLASQDSEYFKAHAITGVYSCAYCKALLFSSADKFTSNKRQAAFRAPALPSAVQTFEEYSLGVPRLAIQCSACKLPLGFLYSDGKETGDTHVNAKQRYAPLSLCLLFEETAGNVSSAPPQVSAVAQKATSVEDDLKKPSARVQLDEDLKPLKGIAKQETTQGGISVLGVVHALCVPLPLLFAVLFK